jgi:hypothetical protein
MSNLCLSISNLERENLVSLAGSLQTFIEDEIEFSIESPGNLTAHLCLVNEVKHAPFRVLTPEHIILSTAEAESICQYLGTNLEQYMELCVALALVQQQALLRNPMLKSEDLLHAKDVHCLFNRSIGVSNFATHLEHMSVCKGCRDFYHCLGNDRELEYLQKQMDRWPNQLLG